MSAGSRGGVPNTVRVERNTFTLAADPPPTEGHAPFRNLGPDLEAAVMSGANTFEGMQP
jgi:hypothetical protein